MNLKERERLTTLFAVTLGHASAASDLLKQTGIRDPNLANEIRSGIASFMQAADRLGIQPDPSKVGGWGYETLDGAPVLAGKIMAQQNDILTVGVACQFCGESHTHFIAQIDAEKGPLFQSAGCIHDSSPFMASGYHIQIPALEQQRWANWQNSNTQEI